MHGEGTVHAWLVAKYACMAPGNMTCMHGAWKYELHGAWRYTLHGAQQKLRMHGASYYPVPWLSIAAWKYELQGAGKYELHGAWKYELQGAGKYELHGAWKYELHGAWAQHGGLLLSTVECFQTWPQIFY